MLAERFWRNVDIRGEDECWIWTGGYQGKGYGQFWLAKGRPIGAHRFAWATSTGGELLPGVHICHKCDNPPCCNPSHLFAGSAADNMRDKSRKGRNPGNRTDQGRKVHAVRGDDAITALAMVAAGWTQRAVARHFGVSPAAICRGLQAARLDERNAALAEERCGMFLTIKESAA